MRGPPDPEKSNPPDPDSLAAEGEGGSDRNLGARLGRYGTAKARSHQMAGYVLKDHDPALSHRLYRCGAHLHFREWADHDNRVTLHRGMFCQVPLLCPLCAIRRGGKMLRRYVERAAYLLRDHDLHLVTLTVRNGDDLAERFAHLKTSMRKLRERAKKGYGAFAQASGALWSFEFTRSEHGWHPHVHMVWAVPKGSAPIRWGEGSQLREDWHAITGDSFITHAEPIQADDREQLLRGFCEVLKYALKFSGLSLADNLAAYRTLKGRRLISSSGVWWGLELPEDAKLEDDELDGPFIEIVYRWAGGAGYVLEDSWVGERSSAGVALREDPLGTMIPPQESPPDAQPHQALDSSEGHPYGGDARPARPLGGAARRGAGGDQCPGDRGFRAAARGAGRSHRGDGAEGGRPARSHDGAPAGRAAAPG